ncbi:S8 family serine peptidase [Streptosporangium sandarakinum]
MQVRRRTALLSVLVATTLAAAGTGSAYGDSPAPVPGVTGIPASPTTTARVTLITGDQVTVTGQAGKPVSVNVTPYNRSAADILTFTVGTDVYVMPREAEALIGSGQVDKRLFNVTQLIAQGYDDARTGSIPLIVRYSEQAAKRSAAPSAPDGGRITRNLPGVRGAAITADKKQGGRFWEAVDDDTAEAGTPKARLTGGIQHLWLDGKAKLLLDKSVPQIGAPGAWAAGYDGTGVKVAVLDTGVDPGHPDLAGKIAESRSFVPGEEVKDDHGHGTHVASTIAGSGAASGGRYKGVAPGATLLVGKVLTGDGGMESWILEGMTWAAHSGAKVVSMSLGGQEGADGTDPLAMAVNQLTAETGALFTIAAGNSGPKATTVGSPGVADAALTVGAVDSADEVTSFSSRGPRGGDGALKPEITAPGFQIVAARATGTTMGTPVSESYTAASGTSMATPHVAGAAALLAQAHPDWTAPRLKSQLISTAKTTAGTPVHSQGAGRVDVDRAVRQSVSGPGTVDFGLADWDSGRPVTKQIGYVNDGDQPVTLTLSAKGAGEDLPAKALSLGAETVTVPAHGTASVDVTVDTAAATEGAHGAHVTAASADGQTVVTTAVGFVRDVERFNVTLKVLDRDGKPSTGVAAVRDFNLGTLQLPDEYAVGEDGTLALRLPRGEHAFQAEILHYSAEWNRVWEYTYAVESGTLIDSDRTIVFDGSKAGPVTIDTPKPNQTNRIRLGLTVRNSAGTNSFGLEQWLNGETKVYSVPSQHTNDHFESRVAWSLSAPELQARAIGSGGGQIEPAYIRGWVGSARIDGTRVLPVVNAGTGLPQDYAGRTARGGLALVKRSAALTPQQQIDNAAAVGAGAIIIYNDKPDDWGLDFWATQSATAIPAMTLSGAQGARLAESAARGGAKVQLKGTATSPYSYELLKYWRGGLPADQRYRVRADELATVESSFHASAPGTEGGYFRLLASPMQISAPSVLNRVVMPRSVTEFVTADVRTWELMQVGPVWRAGEASQLTTPVVLRAGQRVSRDWNGAVVRTALPSGTDQAAVRIGDTGVILASGLLDTAPSQGITRRAFSDKELATVYRNGELLGSAPSAAVAFPMTPERAEYRVVTDAQRDQPWWTTSTKVNTDWRFRSEKTGDSALLPVLSIDYDLDVDLANSVPANSATRVGLGLRYPKGMDGPRITGAKLWASYDDGATWQEVGLAAEGDAAFTGTIRKPASVKAGEFVSLRAQATDADGNTVLQTVTRAYRLRH